MGFLDDIRSALRQQVPALRTLPEKTAAMRRRVAEIDDEMVALKRLPPDLASAVAWVRRGGKAKREGYLAVIGRWYFSEKARQHYWSDHANTDETVNLLAVPRLSPDHHPLVPQTDLTSGWVSDLAVHYLLADALDELAPLIVEKFWPETRNGISDAERAKRLAALQSERDAIVNSLADLDATLAEIQRAAS